MPLKNDMWDRLAGAERATGRTVLDSLEVDWFTSFEYAEQYKVSPSAAQRRLGVLAKDGVLETKKVMLRIGQSTQRVRIYKLKDK